MEYGLMGLGLLGVVLVVYISVRVLLKPVKLLWKLLVNSGMGLLLIMIINFIGQYFGLSLPINMVNVLVAGFLGIPGVLILIGIELLM